MNNERFKFRVWDTIEKTYDYKFPYNQLGVFYMREDGRLCSDFGNTVCPQFKQDRFTIEQCTGLKDIYNTLAYENDRIIVRKDGWAETTGYIKWDSELLAFALYSEDGNYLHDFYHIKSGDFEIIGNIHTDKGE